MVGGITEPVAANQPPEPPALVAAAPLPRFARFQLLNPYTSRHTDSLALGVVGFRAESKRSETVGLSLGLGEQVTTLRGAFWAGIDREFELRFVRHDALSLSLWRYQWEGGLRLGKLEPGVRVGMTLLHLDVGHGFSFGLLSPRVGAGVWFKLPRSRIGVSAFSEYFWRWTGDESAFVHGLVLELQPDAEPLVQGSRVTFSPSSPARP